MAAMRTATAATTAEEIMDIALAIMATISGRVASDHGDQADMEA
jgi:hypothetical protein